MLWRRTRIKYLLNAIRKNKVSFFAVAFIAAASISLYFGIQSANVATLQSASDYFVNNKLETLEIRSANGFTKEDVEEIAALEGVELAEGGYTQMVLAQSEREVLTLQAISLNETLNIPVVLEGVLPQLPNEMAVEETYAKRRDIKVGDVLQLEHDGALVEDSFRVTAIINYPVYCCNLIADTRGTGAVGLGAAAYYIGLPQTAFRQEYYWDRFSVVRVRDNDLDAFYYYSEEYAKREAALIEQVEVLGRDRNWVVSGRNDVGDLRSTRMIVDMTQGISYSMSVIFLLVAVVVCYATASRAVAEQSVQVGTQKAMGYSAAQVRNYYLVYNLLCGFIGIVCGWLLGVFIIENAVILILERDLLIGNIAPVFAWREAFLAAIICIVIFVGTAFVASSRMAQRPVMELIRNDVRGRTHQFFFEKWAIYRKGSLYSRIIVKNVAHNRERMLTTIMGVVGCISLLFMCFSLKMSIEDSYATQNREYFLYENRLVIDSRAGNAADFAAVLEEEGVLYTRIHDKPQYFRVPDGQWESGRIAAVEDSEALDGFMHLEDAVTGKQVEVPRDGVLVTRKCAENLDLAAGSVVEVMDAFGGVRRMQVAGVIEHYFQYHLFVTADSYYEQVMEVPADSCVFLLKGEIDEVYERVRNMDGFLSLKDNSEYVKNADAIYFVIGICLVLSAAMAFLVLLNQIVVHINKNAKELAIMRINGYTIRETQAYIYRDNIVLTVLGLLVGSGIGVALSYLVIRVMERDINRYVRVPNGKAVLYACIIGAAFALLVNVIALRRIKNLHMPDINAN